MRKRTPKKEECIIPMRCITFDKEAQNALPEHIKAKMKADRDKARAELNNQNVKSNRMATDNSKLIGEIIDRLYGLKFGEAWDVVRLFFNEDEILEFTLYEGFTAIDLLRVQHKDRLTRPGKSELYELICEALGVNQFATKEELKQLIDQL